MVAAMQQRLLPVHLLGRRVALVAVAVLWAVLLLPLLSVVVQHLRKQQQPLKAVEEGGDVEGKRRLKAGMHL